MSPLKVAVVGATGAVGREMWRLLETSALPVDAAVPYTSARSRGTPLPFRGSQVACRELGADPVETVQLALFSAGARVAREWAPRFAAAGATVVDNSSAFRADPACPLVVPEINGDTLSGRAPIIANPNCSTIQMVVALAPLHRTWGLATVRVATYQSVSGAGARAMEELRTGSRAHLDREHESPSVFPHPIAFNVLPHVGSITGDGESEEEIKMRNETRRILDLPDLPLSATCVRVPVFRGHSESVWASFARTPDPDRAREILGQAGVTVVDDPARARYPLPREAAGRPDVYAGRIRRDPADSRGLVLWVVSDNLLKGAATNAFQIAESLLARGLLASTTA